jgi:hypothetical protein
MGRPVFQSNMASFRGSMGGAAAQIWHIDMFAYMWRKVNDAWCWA